MAIQATGPINLSDLALEFGGVPPYSLSEYYREAGRVPANNTNVPTSGAIGFGHFFNAVNEIAITATSAASLDLSATFGVNWGTAVPKRLIVPAGVTLGPVTAPAGMSGTLVIQNAGEIQGTGGAANGGAGGNAITANQSFTLINTGAVRGGGGGGGAGGNGGMGRVTVYGGLSLLCYSCSSTICPYSGVQMCGAVCGGSARNGWQYWRYCPPVYTYYSGGGGGAGGRGTGYGQSFAYGSAGSASSNAYGGAGGAGGAGSTWATTGVTGSSGANGNYATGSAGGAGGAAGLAVYMVAGTVTVTNTGTINGAY